MAEFKYRGRVVSSADILYIRDMIAAHPEASRRTLSKKLCEAWGWRQPNGTLSDMVCGGLLVQFERAGEIQLPPVSYVRHNPLARRARPTPLLLDTTPNPKPAGRKRGAAYGERYRKTIPEQVDEVITVPLPAYCDCGGALEVEKVESQYQQEVVRKTIWRRFDIAIGRCCRCRRRVQGRDRRQTSDALGAAAVQLGPEALALGVKMNKGLGMPHGDVAAVLRIVDLRAHRRTICRTVERVVRRSEPSWHPLRDAARRSRVNAMDETGWNVEAQLRWLWVVVSEQVTFCDILPGRGFRDPTHEPHEELREWVGGGYDAETFSMEAVNRILTRLVPRRTTRPFMRALTR
jgi:hypothetical protein